MRLYPLALIAAGSMYAAGLDGTFTGAIVRFGDPQFSRVVLKTTGDKLTGTWGGISLEGTLRGTTVEISYGQNKLTGTLAAESAAGNGQIQVQGARENVTWSIAPEKTNSGPAKTWTYEPTEFPSFYNSAIPPVLHVFPGDTIKTSTVDSGGIDGKGVRRSTGGNAETGPFYVEGALPGDTLVVKLIRLRPNRPTARGGSRINAHAVDATWVGNVKYDAQFDNTWNLDLTKNVATMAHPTASLKNYSVPIVPMLGCIGVAPPGRQSYRAFDLGSFGGNMDYNRISDGTTVYLPVYHPGALLSLGDGHAAMGDGEVTTSALETSLDIEFTVDLIRGYASAGPRAENAEFLMSMGVAGGLQDSLQAATTQMAGWLKRDYELSDSETAAVLGTALRYDVTELVDPQYNVSARIAKSALASLTKVR
jgi:acetamidase/formamidase